MQAGIGMRRLAGYVARRSMSSIPPPTVHKHTKVLVQGFTGSQVP